jgi:SpoVK/Ycf46/Vps4 family AAA+-type ATPase
MPVLRLDVGSLFGSYIGQSEANMRKALKTAEALAPCILWIDELEKSLGTNTGGTDGGTTARVFGAFLNWMQEKTNPVFVVATANDVTQLPPEMLRKGRFDELFFVDLPSREARDEIFRIHLQLKGRDPNKYEVEELGMSSDQFSGAEIESVVVDGLYRAFAAGRELQIGDMLRAIMDTVPLAKTMGTKIDSLRKWAKTRARYATSTSETETIERHDFEASRIKRRTPGRKVDFS